MRGLPSILSLFRNEFNKSNNIGARMLDSIDSIYHMTLTLLKNRIFGVKTSRLCHLFSSVKWTLLHYTSGLSILLHGVIALPDATPCDNKKWQRFNNCSIYRTKGFQNVNTLMVQPLTEWIPLNLGFNLFAKMQYFSRHKVMFQHRSLRNKIDKLNKIRRHCSVLSHVYAGVYSVLIIYG